VELPLDVLQANRIDPELFRQIDAESGAGERRGKDGFMRIYRAVGCPKCGGSGYKGRGAIMEVLPIDEAIKELIMKGGSSSEIREQARARGMVTLKETGLRKVKEGVTSLEAALEMTGSE
jgi:type IV pilus assembly protein PilB